MKTLILDEATWRCGGSESEIKPTTGRGKGGTCLLNNEGFMCCLGSFSLQLEPSLKPEDILRKAYPFEIGKLINPLSQIGVSYIGKEHLENTKLSRKAVDINDCSYTSIKEKVKLLKELFSEEGYEIKFIRKAWLPRLIDKISLRFFSNISSN